MASRLPDGDTVIIIPTRNRADLVVRAIRSATSLRRSGAQIVVSDNSTSAADSAAIAASCRADGVRCIRPPAPLAMAEHWDWAIRETRRLVASERFLLLSSRWVVHRRAMTEAMDLARRHRGAIVSYNDEMIRDDPGQAVWIDRKNLTGRVFAVEARHLLYLVSKAIFPACLPRLLNCIVPWEVEARVRARFGSVCASIAPDHCFSYRCLTTEDRVVYYDAAALLQYGNRFSTGLGLLRKAPNEAAADFRSTRPAGSLAASTPLPDVELNINVAFHEYCAAAAQVGAERFPALDRARYLDALAAELAYVDDVALRERLAGVLRQHGWTGLLPPVAPPVPADPAAGRRRLATRLGLWLAGWLRPGSLPAERLAFKTVDDAIWFAQREPPRFVEAADHLAYLQAGWVLPQPAGPPG